MIKSILSAVDGSPESLAGLEQAVAWAERLGAELRVVAVQDERRFVRYPTYSDTEGSIPRPIPLEGPELERAEEEASQEEAEIRAAFDAALQERSVRADLRVLRGAVERTLVREARATDMVVLGKRGRGLDPGGKAAGPTTETMIQALRPVLVVPTSGNHAGPILVPFDGSKGAQRVVVPGVQLAVALNVPLTVITIAEGKATAEDIQAPLRKYMAPYGVKAQFQVEVGRDTERGTARVILDKAKEMNAGMIMMGAFSVGPLREFFVGSVTRSVLDGAPCPVLMMT